MQQELFLTITKAEQQFNQFNFENPHVYRRLVELTRELKARGHRKIGIGMLFEVMRWEWMRQTTGDHYKLNNNYRSRYARMIIENEPELENMFELRELRS